MGEITAGIDPGVTGAISIIKDGRPEFVIDMPIMAKLVGKGNQVNGAELTTILLYHGVRSVIVEAVHSMPGQGSVSTFNFGYSTGIIHGVLMALQIPFELVTPQKWKKQNSLIGKDKDAARSLCLTRFPWLSEELRLKKHHGRADAILIGLYEN